MKTWANLSVAWKCVKYFSICSFGNIVSHSAKIRKMVYLFDCVKRRYPTFFDDIAARLLPVIPLVVYRLIENDALDAAYSVLGTHSLFLAYHPLRFSFVRDILAYFYGHLPGNFVVRVLKVLDLSKVIGKKKQPIFL